MHDLTGMVYDGGNGLPSFSFDTDLSLNLRTSDERRFTKPKIGCPDPESGSIPITVDLGITAWRIVRAEVRIDVRIEERKNWAGFLAKTY